MPRKYTHKPGTKVRNHHHPNLQKAFEDLNSGKKSLTEAAKFYKIPKTTLHDKYNRKYREARPGRRNALSDQVEQKLVDFLLTTSLWGFPQSNQDLINFVKPYLDTHDIKIAQFRNGNEPGVDWARGFLERHKDKLTERYSNNIKRSRAQISGEIIDKYFDELEKALEGITPEAIFNYDESNLADDPGKKKFIFKEVSNTQTG